jgi:hypothetical protein
MIYPAIANNPLRTRADLQQAMRDLFEPLVPYFTPGCAGIHLSGAGTRHGEHTEAMEAFVRPLWGLIPLAKGDGAFAHWELYRQGFTHGPDATHAEAWLDVTWASQAHVEMAAIGIGLALTPEKIWTPLSADAQERLVNWLLSINQTSLPKNNWYFFRVLVNVGLRSVGARHDPGVLEQTLTDIGQYYLGDGWYSDGVGQPCDYYVSFALHFYGLIYAVIAGREDPARAALYRERAAIFARDFITWQDGDGAMLPYGRSLTYRFAQVAFWSAYAFAGVEGDFSPGVAKGLVLRHLRWWFARPIFNEIGILSVGYGYPNLLMAENYNGPGSPYWALKSFLVLALPEEHAFWQAEEQPLPELPPRRDLVHAGMIVTRDTKQDITVALCSGLGSQFSHWAEKYMKFAYAPHFGICVPAEGVGLHRRGHDNALALSEEGEYWRVRRETVARGTCDGRLWSLWKPWADVEVTSWVWPEDPWHLRVHLVRNRRHLLTAEGGFAIARPHAEARLPDDTDHPSGHGIRVRGLAAASTIVDLLGTRTAERVDTEVNSHLYLPHAHIPTLRGVLEPGEHWLVTAVRGERSPISAVNWDDVPSIAWSRLRGELRCAAAGHLPESAAQ